MKVDVWLNLTAFKRFLINVSDIKEAKDVSKKIIQDFYNQNYCDNKGNPIKVNDKDICFDILENPADFSNFEEEPIKVQMIILK